MRRTGFDKHLRRVFTFIAGLTVLVSIAAILSNRYIAESHRALIEDNMPIAALTREIQANSVNVATLATSFADADRIDDLTGLTGSLLSQVGALQSAVDELSARVPDLDARMPVSFVELDATVRSQSEAALDRIRAWDNTRVGLEEMRSTFATLEAVLETQTDTARVQVTATIADLFDNAGDDITDRLGTLADVNFFAYDRLYELSRAVDGVRTEVLQVDTVTTLAGIATSRAAVERGVALARRRLEYLPSANARSEAAALIASIEAELAPGGVYSDHARALSASAEISVALEEIRAQTTALVGYSDTLFGEMQAQVAASQARTERLGQAVTWGLLIVLALAILAAGLAWQAVSRRTVARLAGVSRHIMALARGDYDRDIPETGDDEIGRMERALHVLRLRAAEARKLRDELESAVVARTREVVTEMNAHDLARAEAEAANRAKSEFLAMMGHEIRTPLNGVVGMLRVLEADAVDPAQHHRATLARQSAENLLTLSNDILDYASTQEQKPVVVPVHFDLRDLMGQLGGYLNVNAAEKGLEAGIDMAPNAPPVLFGDLAKIRQVLINLLSNAVKYTERGHVSLFLDHALDPEHGAHVLSFSVTDTGIGIAPSEQARIFDAYSRGVAHAAEGIEGLGLGLSVCRRLTEALGGALIVESAPNEGSRFTFSIALPEGDVAQVLRHGEPMQVADLGRLVLVVEDQPVNRMVARSYLERMGCTVVEAETGAAGVTAALGSAFDLVLMDIDLPDMSGGDAAAQIRASAASPPPIAALTAHHIEASPEQREALNVDHILHKPLSPRELAALLGAAPEAASFETIGPETDRITAALTSDVEDIGAGETAAIVVAFLDQVGPALGTMQAAEAAGDMEALARQAHRLKGAASNFALTGFCAHLGRIEEAANEAQGVAEAVRGIDATASETCAALTTAARTAGLQLPSASASR